MPVIWRVLLPVVLLALLLVVPSGLAMFAVLSEELLTARLFIIKMAILMTLAGLAIGFHAGPYPALPDSQGADPEPLSAKLIAVASIALWLTLVYVALMLPDGAAPI